MSDPEVRSALGAGSEPYDLDFGDREYAAWLAENLTPLEHHDRMQAFRRWYEARDRWARRLGGADIFKWRGRVVIWLLDPLTWRLGIAWRDFDALARERGGPPPGPSWKVRTEEP